MEVKLVCPFVRRALKAFYKKDKPEANANRDSRSSRQRREANNEPRVNPFTLPTHFLVFSFEKKSNTNLNMCFTETSMKTVRSLDVMSLLK